jgi:hypothetical protein
MIPDLSSLELGTSKSRGHSLGRGSREHQTVEAVRRSPPPMVLYWNPDSVGRSATLIIPELEQSKTAVLNTLASVHSRWSYAYAIERLSPGNAANPD